MSEKKLEIELEEYSEENCTLFVEAQTEKDTKILKLLEKILKLLLTNK